MLKTRAELEQEIVEAKLRRSGNYAPPLDKDCIPYVRQSSTAQTRKNKYGGKTAIEALIDIALDLGWSINQIRDAVVENESKRDGKLRGVSGRKPIEERAKLKQVVEEILTGTVGALLVEDISRLSRADDMVDFMYIAKVCKAHNVIIVTSDYTYDFRRDKDFEQFIEDALEAANYIKTQVGSKQFPNGKMLKGRNKKASRGYRATGVAPIGLQFNETRDNFIPTVHSERVNWLYKRYRENGASLGALLHEIGRMAEQGIPLFPAHESIDPKDIFLKPLYDGDKLLGWYVNSFCGLRFILSNPMYQGHITFNGKIVARDAFPAIVDESAWLFAYERLAVQKLPDGRRLLVMPDGEERDVEQSEASKRYTHRVREEPNTALLYGTRNDGKPIIDGLNGAHVYYSSGGVDVTNMYILLDRTSPRATKYEAGVSQKRLDRIIEAQLMHRLWRHSLGEMMKSGNLSNNKIEGHRQIAQYELQIMEEVKASPLSGEKTESELLEEVNAELVRVNRRLDVASDIMPDEDLRALYAKKAQLIKRRANLERAIARADRAASEQEQAKRDLETAREKWAGWDLEHKRQFIRMVTDSITLEASEDGVVVTVHWSGLLGNLTESATLKKRVQSLPDWKLVTVSSNREGQTSLLVQYSELHALVA